MQPSEELALVQKLALQELRRRVRGRHARHATIELVPAEAALKATIQACAAGTCQKADHPAEPHVPAIGDLFTDVDDPIGGGRA